MNQTLLIRSAIALSFASLALAASAAGTYTVSLIGTPAGGTLGIANALNDVGAVAGTYTNAAGRQHAFSSKNGVVTDLGTLPADTGAGRTSLGNAINASGTVVGSSTLTSTGGVTHAFAYSNGAISDIGLLPTADSSRAATARGVNDAGTITGFGTTTGGVTHAFSYSNGTMTDLGTMAGGTLSSGQAINASGAIAGFGSGSGFTGNHAFLYQNGAFQDLGSLATGFASQGLAINDSGLVAGLGNVSIFSAHAALFGNGAQIDLGTLGSGTASVANGINNAGFVVGNSNYVSTDNAATHAFLYAGGGAITDLNSLLDPTTGANWVLTNAQDINNNGQIVGYGLYNGVQSAFLLTPQAVPEPSVLAALALGALTFVRRRRRG